MAAALFEWDGGGVFMRWEVPLGTALLYAACCVAHNRSLPHPPSAAPPHRIPAWVDALAALHNAVLVLFSVWIFWNATTLFLGCVLRDGITQFLCPPVQVPNVSKPPPLGGALHYWCYVYYLSKYYELLDTLLLVLRRKRIILLHALHHGLMPLVMYLLFEGAVSVSLVGLAVVNSFVHIVMYTYFLTASLGHKLPDSVRKQITLLQICQFSTGVIGGTYYWLHYFQNPRISPSWPLFTYDVGCAGGELCMVIVGFISNLALLGMFIQFYRKAYSSKRFNAKLK